MLFDSTGTENKLNGGTESLILLAIIGLILLTIGVVRGIVCCCVLSRHYREVGMVLNAFVTDFGICGVLRQFVRVVGILLVIEGLFRREEREARELQRRHGAGGENLGGEIQGNNPGSTTIAQEDNPVELVL